MTDGPDRLGPNDPEDPFEAIVAGWEAEAAGELGSPGMDGGAEPAAADLAVPDFTVPDDLSTLFEGTSQQSIGLILTGFADADTALALAVIAQVPAGVFATEAGAVIAPDDSSATALAAAAQSLGAVVAQLDLLVVRLAGGMVKGARWRSGVEVETVPMALLLGSLPSVVEGLVLGTVSLTDVPDVRRTDGISRMRALKLLADAMRRGRRKRS